MIDAPLRARIRRLFYAEHWRIGTIAAEVGVHHETVRNAVDTERFNLSSLLGGADRPGRARVASRPSAMNGEVAYPRGPN